MARDDTIQALLEERRGYVARGRLDRVDAVDRVLASLGVEVEKTSAPPVVETAVEDKPKARRSTRRKSDDADADSDED